MDTTQVTATIEAQPSVHLVKLDVPHDSLMKEFDKYWEEVKDVLPKDLVKAATKGGYRTVTKERVIKAAGGFNEFYKPILFDVVHDWFKTQQVQALTITQVNLDTTEDTNFKVSAMVHLEPTVTWKNEPVLEIEIPKNPDDAIDKLIDAQLKKLTEDYPILTPVTDLSQTAQEDQIVVVDCESLIMGARWDPGCAIAKKWQVNKQVIVIPEIYEHLKTMKQGDEHSFSFVLPEIERFSAAGGKTVECKLRLIQSYDKKPALLDDDLAKSVGFNTLDALKIDLKTKITDTLKNERQRIINTLLINKIVNPEVVDITAIPWLWLATKAKELYSQMRGMVKTEEELLAQFTTAKTSGGVPVTDKGTLLTFLAQIYGEQMVTNLVLRSFGKNHSVEGDSSLDNIEAYAKLVLAEVVKTAKITEKEFTEADAVEFQKQMNFK